MRFLFIILLTVYASNSYSQSNWFVVNPQPIAGSINHSRFYNEFTGYACGYNGDFYKTTDGGVSWKKNFRYINEQYNKICISDNGNVYLITFKKIYRSTDFGESFNLIYQNNIQYLYDIGVYGNNFIFAIQSSSFIRSTDFGNTWTSVNIGEYNRAIDFANHNTGYIGTATNKKYYRTINGGLNWNIDSLETTQNIQIRKIKFIDSFNGVAGGSYGSIFKTSDAGFTWELLTSNSYYSDFVKDIDFKDPGKIFFLTTNLNRLYSLDSIRTDTNYLIKWNNCLSVKNDNEIFSFGDIKNIVKSTDGGDLWFSIFQGYNYFFHDMKFVNEFTGYATTSDSNYIRRVIKTTDGGLTWSFQHYAIAEKLSFINENTGFAISGSGYAIFKTMNGGVNWLDIDNGTSNDVYREIRFINETTGIVAGSDWSNFQGLLLRTTDAGNSWVKRTFNFTDNFYAIEITDENNLFFGTTDVFKSTDAGLTWNRKTFFSSIVNEIKFLNQNTGYASTMGSIILKTTDGGETWPIARYFEFTIKSIELFGENDVIVSGSNSTHFKISRSTNAGNSFTEHFSTFNYNAYFRNISFVNSNTGYVNFSNNILFKTTGLSSIGISNSSSEIPSDFLLHQNYPNPFNPVTNIKFSLPSTQYTILKIFDITGREITTLVNEQLNAGEYIYQFNADEYGLSSGVYFYRLIVQDYSEVKKMILMK